MKTIKAIVEIPQNSRYKYEFKDNKLVLDRVLNQYIPFNYGFIPDTLADDGDPLDIFIVSTLPIVSLVQCEVVIEGVFKCLDGDKEDDKIVARLAENLLTREDIYKIENYLKTYKRGFNVLSYNENIKAIKVIKAAQKAYNQNIKGAIESAYKAMLKPVK